MNRFLKLLSLCLFLTLTVPLQAITNGVANEPDSVYLFSYSHADGSGGLKLALLHAVRTIPKTKSFCIMVTVKMLLSISVSQLTGTSFTFTHSWLKALHVD